MKPTFFWKRLSWPLQILVWIFAFYVAWNVLPSGYAKLADGTSLEFFEQNNLPYWLFITVGVVELLGSFFIFVPQLSFYGSFSIFIVMSSASYFNDWNTYTIIYAILSLAIAILTRPGLFRKKPSITTVSV